MYPALATSPRSEGEERFRHQVSSHRSAGAPELRAAETGGARAAGVQVENTVSNALRRSVRMARDDRVVTRGSRIDRQVGELVNQVYACVLNFDGQRLRQIAGPLPVSMLPRIAVTGASAENFARTSELPMSPACRIRLTSRRASSASGRRRPWVSEITPTSVATFCIMVRTSHWSYTRAHAENFFLLPADIDGSASVCVGSSAEGLDERGSAG